MESAEHVYMFRHALMRQGAYELVPPTQRSELHAIALDAIEALPIDEWDSIAGELADHAQNAWMHLPDAARRVDLQTKEARWLKQAAEYARNNANLTRAFQLWTRLADNPTADAETRMNALLQATEMGNLTGRVQETFDLLERAEALAEQLAAPTWTGLMLLTKRRVQFRTLRNIEEGLALIDNALEHFRAAGDTLNEAKALGERGNILSIMARDEEALEMFQRSEQLFRELNHAKGTATSRGNIAICLRRFGRLDEAEAMLKDNIAEDRAAGRKDDLARDLANLSFVYRDKQQLEEALAVNEEAENLFRDQGDNVSLARTLLNTGLVRDMLGQLHLAVSMFARTEKLAYESGMPTIAASGAFYRAQALLKLEDTVRGEEAMEESARAYEAVHDRNHAARSWFELGRSAHARNDFEKVFECTRAALAHWEPKGEYGYELLRLHAEAALGADMLQEAARSAQRALELAPESARSDPIALATLKAIARKGDSAPVN